MKGLVPDETKRLAGVELGGVPLVTALSMEMGLPFVIVRTREKTYGTMKTIEGIYEMGENVTLIEDIVTTGKASMESVNKMMSAGLNVLGVIALIDRGGKAFETYHQMGINYFALFNPQDLEGRT